MKPIFPFTLICLLFSLYSIATHAQPYSSSDSPALLAILAGNISGELNWDTQPVDGQL